MSELSNFTTFPNLCKVWEKKGAFLDKNKHTFTDAFFTILSFFLTKTTISYKPHEVLN